MGINSIQEDKLWTDADIQYLQSSARVHEVCLLMSASIGCMSIFLTSQGRTASSLADWSPLLRPPPPLGNLWRVSGGAEEERFISGSFQWSELGYCSASGRRLVITRSESAELKEHLTGNKSRCQRNKTMAGGRSLCGTLTRGSCSVARGVAGVSMLPGAHGQIVTARSPL